MWPGCMSVRSVAERKRGRERYSEGDRGNERVFEWVQNEMFRSCVLCVPIHFIERKAMRSNSAFVCVCVFCRFFTFSCLFWPISSYRLHYKQCHINRARYWRLCLSLSAVHCFFSVSLVPVRLDLVVACIPSICLRSLCVFVYFFFLIFFSAFRRFNLNRAQWMQTKEREQQQVSCRNCIAPPIFHSKHGSFARNAAASIDTVNAVCVCVVRTINKKTICIRNMIRAHVCAQAHTTK